MNAEQLNEAALAMLLNEKEINVKTKLSIAALIAVLGAFAAPSFAGDAVSNNVSKAYSLKDGGTLYVFKDGKMAQENNFGCAVYLKQGQAYETTDGQKIIANSNEVARLDSLIQQGHKSR